MKILYRLLVVILCFIVPIYFICFSLPFIVCGTIINIFCLHVIFERHINKLFELIDYCNNK